MRRLIARENWTPPHYRLHVAHRARMQAWGKRMRVEHYTVQSGSWDDPATWGGVVPARRPAVRAYVVIRRGHCVTVPEGANGHD